MSEFEMANLFLDINMQLDGLTDSFTALVFAMLVASYFAAARLPRPMVVLVITLFSFMVFCGVF